MQLILSDDLTEEKALFYWEQEAFGRESIFPQQKSDSNHHAHLPFDNPKDYMVQKLNTQLREQGKNPFYDYSLPVAILRLKQAIGRTSRFQDQKGIVGPLIGSAGGDQTIWKTNFRWLEASVAPSHNSERAAC